NREPHARARVSGVLGRICRLTSVGPTCARAPVDVALTTMYRRANLYVKRYVVARGDKRYAYLRLVEAFRDEEGRVRHRVLQTLGREDELKASGQLNQLAASF